LVSAQQILIRALAKRVLIGRQIYQPSRVAMVARVRVYQKDSRGSVVLIPDSIPHAASTPAMAYTLFHADEGRVKADNQGDALLKGIG
jgi:hypothetical protein